jgi:(p)ppGpp synthase/HD superfamily hydrolase
VQPSDRFGRALRFARSLHRDQRRKGTTIPYVAHLLAVAALVLEHGGDEDEAIAALLHDAVEDQGGAATRERIRRRFGARVARIVDGCSDGEPGPGRRGREDWRHRKEHTLAGLGRASRSVLLVAAADKLHNARAVLEDYRRDGEALWTRFNGGRDGTLWYYRSLAAARGSTGRAPPARGGELARVVSDIDRLARPRRARPPAGRRAGERG